MCYLMSKARSVHRIVDSLEFFFFLFFFGRPLVTSLHILSNSVYWVCLKITATRYLPSVAIKCWDDHRIPVQCFSNTNTPTRRDCGHQLQFRVTLLDKRLK